MSAMSTKAESSDAVSEIREAFERLESTITPSDARAFRSTTLQDVRDAAIRIEHKQAQRSCLRNMKRMEPVFKAIDNYSKVIEVLCQGTPYLCFVWAPIKLLLQIADDYTSSFEKLIEAYTQIAESLPRFDRLSAAFEGKPEFQLVLADVYVDILEFHRRAYKFFRRSAWKGLFDSAWGNFDGRFKLILQRLARHQDLVDREALSFEILEAQSWRRNAEDDLERRERDRATWQLRDTFSWLAVKDHHDDQEEHLDKLSLARSTGTCQWIFSHPKWRTWLHRARSSPVLWVKGKPGSGKSVLATHIIESLPKILGTDFAVMYYFCTYKASERNIGTTLLKVLIAQLLKGNPDLLSHVYERYAKTNVIHTSARMKALFHELLKMLPSTRIVIDGLDEYNEEDQKQILHCLISISDEQRGTFPILFISREVRDIKRKLVKFPTIFLSEEQELISRDVNIYIKSTLTDFRERFKSETMDEVEQILVRKANGMFLWVRLVIAALDYQDSARDLIAVVNRLPEGLEGAYGRILERIRTYPDPIQRDYAIRTLHWIACSFRRLKCHEVQDGIAFRSNTCVLNHASKLSKGVLDLCKPIIEETDGSVIDFVHFSAKEYLYHDASGPLLTPAGSHRTIAVSCISYLLTCRIFVEEMPSDELMRQRVLYGGHNLHFYAHEFWARHLINYLDLSSSEEKSCDTWAEMKVLLADLQCYQNPGNLPTYNVVYAACRKTFEEFFPASVLKSLEEIEGIYGLTEKFSLFQKMLNERSLSQRDATDLQYFALATDPTLFSLMFQRFRNVFQKLMSSNEVADLTSPGDQDTVRGFRELHLDSAYLCSFSGCPRSLSGFKTTSECEGHELSHTRQFRCPQISCDFNVTGFTSRVALQKHCRRYHVDLDQNSIPDFIGHPKIERKTVERSVAFGDRIAASEYRNALKRSLGPEKVWSKPHMQEPIDLCNHIKRARLGSKKEIADNLEAAPAPNEMFSPAFFLREGVPLDPVPVMRTFNEEDHEADCKETSQGPGEDQTPDNGSLSNILQRQILHSLQWSSGDLTNQGSAWFEKIIQGGAEHIATPLAESQDPDTMLSELEYGLEDDSEQLTSIALTYKWPDMHSEDTVQP